MSGLLLYEDGDEHDAFPWWRFCRWVGPLEVDGVLSAGDGDPMITLKDDVGGAAARLRWDCPPDEDELADWDAGRWHVACGVPAPADERRPR